jgi:hypothetical protein
MKRDDKVFQLIEMEHRRQLKGIELIASENFVSNEVMQAMGSCLTNKYAEGYPGKRYYGGCEVVDKVEKLSDEQSADALVLVFRAHDDILDVIVQPHVADYAGHGDDGIPIEKRYPEQGVLHCQPGLLQGRRLSPDGSPKRAEFLRGQLIVLDNQIVQIVLLLSSG